MATPSSDSRKIYVAGHRGMVGGAVVRALRRRGHPEPQLLLRARRELDLLDAAATRAFLARERPDLVIVAAAKVGGILANSRFPADFLHENLVSAVNVIHGALAAGVPRLLFLGSACIYPRLAPQPIGEDALLAGPLEPTNEAYAIAKITGMKLCQAFRRQHGVLYHSAMPNNLYGPGDNYHPEHSHVLPALIRRFHEAARAGAPEVVLWGTGAVRREFIYVDDCADALLHIAALPAPADWYNIGYGEDATIREAAELVAETVGFRGRIVQDTSKPDGMPRKLLDTSRLAATGWTPRTGLREGLKLTYASFLKEIEAGALRK